MGLADNLIDRVKDSSLYQNMQQQAAEYERAILGDVKKDFGVIETRKMIAGNAIEIRAQESMKEKDRLLVLRVAVRSGEGTKVTPVLLRQAGVYAVSKALGSSDSAFLGLHSADELSLQIHARQRKQDGIIKRFLHWIEEKTFGRELHHFGTIEDFEMPVTIMKKSLIWREHIEAQLISKGGEALFVLNFRADYPGGGNNMLDIPFGATGREGLRKVLREMKR